MSYKSLVVIASILFFQNVYSQVIPTSSFSNSAVPVTNIEVGNIGLNLANSATNLANVGLSLANSGAVVGSGLNAGTFGGLSSVGFSGPLIVTSASPIAPSGLVITSENVIEGVLSVSGTLPYLSAVAFEAALPTAGSGVATCGCGSGGIGIISDSVPSSTVTNFSSGQFLL